MDNNGYNIDNNMTPEEITKIIKSLGTLKLKEGIEFNAANVLMEHFILSTWHRAYTEVLIMSGELFEQGGGVTFSELEQIISSKFRDLFSQELTKFLARYYEFPEGDPIIQAFRDLL